MNVNSVYNWNETKKNSQRPSITAGIYGTKNVSDEKVMEFFWWGFVRWNLQKEINDSISIHNQKQPRNSKA